MNLKLLYSEKAIIKFLKPLMNVDIYDDLTINHYEKKYLTDLTENDLEIMLKTIEDKSVSLISSQSLGNNIFNIYIALVSIISSISISFIAVKINSFLSNGDVSLLERFSDFTYYFLYLFIFVVFVVSLSFFQDLLKLRKIEKVKKVIKILIAIKNKNDK